MSKQQLNTDDRGERIPKNKKGSGLVSLRDQPSFLRHISIPSQWAYTQLLPNELPPTPEILNELLRQSAARPRKDQQALRIRAHALMDLGHNVEAIHWFEQLVAADPENGELHHLLGVAKLRISDYPGAFAELSSAWRHCDEEEAQLVEQAAVNRWVVGSSPTGGAPFFRGIRPTRWLTAGSESLVNSLSAGIWPLGDDVPELFVTDVDNACEGIDLRREQHL